MKHFLYLLLICFFTIASAQKTANAIKVTYVKSSNGKLLENQDPIIVFADARRSVITSENATLKKADFPYEQFYVDWNLGSFTQEAFLKDGSKVATIDTISIAKQSFELLSDTKTILGYKCKKAKTIINSNTIEVWYTNDIGIKGAPTTLGQKLGLVLEVNRNGNFIISAQKIEKIKAIPSSFSFVQTAKPVDMLTYRDILWRSRFKTISVLRNEIINFSDASKSDDSIKRFANGTIIVEKIRLPEIKSGSQIFLDVTEQSNGDAYDRTGSVFIIPTEKQISFFNGLNATAKSLPVYENGNGKQYQGVVQTDDYSPLIELMRFFTPFGIKQYNHIQLKNKTWQDSVYYRQDVSEIMSAIGGKEIWIGANIGNYDKGGHKVSINLTIHPEESKKSVMNFIMPLFNTNNVMEMAGQEYGTMFNHEKGLEVKFKLNTDIKNAKLRYITTGHGGWENGDEFLPKKNTILLDGGEVYAFTPWRMDCGSFRSYNPASGNFNNGLSSSDYSRSNWCPGTVTNPVFIDLGDLKAGDHTIQVKIPQGAPEGGSFSSWNVSGLLIGNQ